MKPKPKSEKKITMALLDYGRNYRDGSPRPFLVKSIINTLEFRVGDTLTKEQVQGILDDRPDINVRFIIGEHY